MGGLNQTGAVIHTEVRCCVLSGDGGKCNFMKGQDEGVRIDPTMIRKSPSYIFPNVNRGLLLQIYGF